jgi:hypothetical protein
MDDLPVRLDWLVAVLLGRLFQLLAASGIVVLSSFSNVNAQQTPPLNIANGRPTPYPDVDRLQAKEKATPFENLLLDKIENDIRVNPLRAPDIVSEALVTNVSNPLTFAGHLVQRANQALGQKLNQVEIARIVLAAVRARPQAAIEIVRGAIQTTPARLHPNIVAAAVAGVPDAYLRAEVTTGYEIFGETLNIRRQPILEDRILYTEGNQEFIEEVALGYEAITLSDYKTLAEVLIDAAIQAGSSASIYDLQQAVDLVLQNNFGFPSIVGNPADSNTNITAPPPVTPTPTPATPTPTPSPVSP